MSHVEIVIKQQGQQDRVVRLPEGATRMGRAEDNEIVLSDVGVSRRHAQIYVSRGDVTVEDLGSGNGTYYNGYRVQSQLLGNGDEVVIDPFVLQFRVPGAQGASPASGVSTPARLDVVVGPGMAGTSYPIEARGLSMGRSEDREVVIPDPAASRHHCQISPEGDEYVLRDRGSANGVFVNAVRVRECTLQDGDLVRIGNTEMRFVRTDRGGRAPAPAAAPAPAGGGAPPPPVAPPPRRTPSPAPRADAAYAPAPAPSGGRSRIFMFLFVVLLGMVMVLALALMALIASVLYMQYGMSEAEPLPTTPIAFTLQLPSLPGAEVSELVEEGTKGLQDGDHIGAFQSFYRARDVHPEHPRLGAMLFMAGQELVVEEMNNRLATRAKEEEGYGKQRNKYLRESKARRGAWAAMKKLEQEPFRDDPVVIEKMNFKGPSNSVREEIQKLERAEDLLKKELFDDGILIAEKVLRTAKYPELRSSGLDIVERGFAGLAEQTRPLWIEAQQARLNGDLAAAESAFANMAKGHEADVSARVNAGLLQLAIERNKL